jgi:hypothetical protein
MSTQRSLFIVLIMVGGAHNCDAMKREVTFCYQASPESNILIELKNTIPVTLYNKNILIIDSCSITHPEKDKNTLEYHTEQLTNFASIYLSFIKAININNNSLNMARAIDGSLNPETSKHLKTYNEKNFNPDDAFDNDIFFVTTDNEDSNNENPKDKNYVIGIPGDVSKLSHTINVITHSNHTPEDCKKFTEICSTLFGPTQTITDNEKKILTLDQKSYNSVKQNIDELKQRHQNKPLEHGDGSSISNNYYLKVGGVVLVIAGTSYVVFKLLPEENSVKKFIKKTVNNITYYVTKLYS